MPPTSAQHRPFVLTLVRVLLEKRWLVFIIGVLVVLTVETIEHWSGVLTLDKHFLNEALFYGILGPLVVWFLLRSLAKTLYGDKSLTQIQAEASQAERQRIARDLHDKLAQNLGYLHLKLDHLAASGEASLPEIEAIQTDLEQMRHIANQAYEEVRGTLETLRNESELPVDLAGALYQQAQTMANWTGLDIHVDYQNNIQLSCPILKRAVINIVREAVNNINKHADASQVLINLTGDQLYTFLTIADNGKGFDPAEARPYYGHYGLSIMRERAEEMGGRLTVESTPGRGTQLTVRFPNNNA